MSCVYIDVKEREDSCKIRTAHNTASTGRDSAARVRYGIWDNWRRCAAAEAEHLKREAEVHAKEKAEREALEVK
jgi:hypothetical protein